MYRSVTAPTHSHRWQETWARLLAPLTLWICVSVSLRYGYYGDCRMVLGPSSSRLIKASSVFVDHIELRDDDRKGVSLYAFSHKPHLTYDSNWTTSNFFIVSSYSRKGFHLWLNKGSRIRVKWEAQISSLDQLQMIMIKGERNYEMLEPQVTNYADSSASSEQIKMKDCPILGKEAEYVIEEDDRYYVGVINSNRRSIILTATVNVSSKMYDISEPKNICSTLTGSCQLKLLFPSTQYVLITTPSSGDLGGWYVELSFVARMVTYIAILGFIVTVIIMILKYLGSCDGESTVMDTISERDVNETDPILPDKPTGFTYGTIADDPESGSSSSSEDLYDAKLCIICYDEQRNCFFVPCGHCATCYDCAQRIMEGDSKVCPICRRLIHKVRRLFNP